MRIRVLLLAILFLAEIAIASDGPEAFLRMSASGAPFVDVYLRDAPPPARGPISGNIQVEGALLTSESREISPGVWRFALPVRTDLSKTLRFAIDTYQDAEGHQRAWSGEVGRDFTLKLVPVRCRPGQLAVVVDDSKHRDPEYTKRRLDVIELWGKSHVNPNALFQITVEPRNEKKIRRINLRSFDQLRGENDIRFCLELTDKLPTSPFDFEIAFLSEPPFELMGRIFKSDVKSDVLSTPAAPDWKKAIGDRAFERNLDAAIVLTSGVEEVEKIDGGQTQKVRERRTRATFDIFLQPLLDFNQLRKEKPRRRNEGNTDPEWFLIWTPIFVNARVSSGAIEKQSLSLNQIVFGTEAELRYRRKGQQQPVSYHRFILRATNASDRDFKQAEWKIAPEYRPVVGILSRPLSTRLVEKPNELRQEKQDRELKQYYETWFGHDFQPYIGVALGRTWRRESLAPAVPMSEDFVRRFYFGGELRFEFTPRFVLTAADTLYRRFEASSDPWHNYFKGEFMIRLGNPSPSFSYGLFAQFERGGKPPFNKPDVNAIKIGVRAVMDGWFGIRR